MSCRSGGEERNSDLVECLVCGMKVARHVAAVMYLKGKEYIFCSHECQDRWEERHPGELW